MHYNISSITLSLIVTLLCSSLDNPQASPQVNRQASPHVNQQLPLPYTAPLIQIALLRCPLDTLPNKVTTNTSSIALGCVPLVIIAHLILPVQLKYHVHLVRTD